MTLADIDLVRILSGSGGSDPFGNAAGVSVQLEVSLTTATRDRYEEFAVMAKGTAFRTAPLLAVLDTGSGRLIAVGRCHVTMQPRQSPVVKVLVHGLWLSTRDTAPSRSSRSARTADRSTGIDQGWRQVSEFDGLRELLMGWLRHNPHATPADPEGAVTMIAKAITESSREDVYVMRSLRYDLERVISVNLRRSSTHDLEVVLADVVELTVAISRARDEATNAQRGGLGSWRTSPAAYHAQRRLQDPTLPARPGALGARRQRWFAVLDAGVRQCVAMERELTEESVLLHQLLDATASVSVARDAQAQETFTLVATVGALLIGIPALVIALYGATSVLPIQISNSVILLPIAVAGLIAGLVAAYLPGRQRTGKALRFTVTVVAALVTIILLAVSGSLVHPIR